METIEIEENDAGLMEAPCYFEDSAEASFATPLQLFAVILYLITQGFTIPILPIGPSWAVWPKLDDFSTVFLVLVYLCTRKNTCPMNKSERFVSKLLITGIIASIPSTLLGKLMYPEIPKGLLFGINQTYRFIEYFMVWICMRGMIFSSKQFNKISYTAFFVVIFVLIIAIGNMTGVIPTASLLRHLPYDGPWGVLKVQATGAGTPLGPYGWNAGYMVDQLVFWTALILASKKPSAMFRIPLVAVIAFVVFFTGSRAATAAWCLFLVIWAQKSLKQLVIMLLIASLFLTSFYMFSSRVEYEVAERATTKLRTIIYREEDPTMSGRTVQWWEILDYIILHPYVLAVGVGWGFGGTVLVATTTIGMAHCMYLQAVLEIGIFGAILFYLLLFNIYRQVQGKDLILIAARKAFLALLVAGITGEVFYLVPGGGSFLGFVAAVLAISVGTHRGRLLEEQYRTEYEPLVNEDSGFEYAV